VPPITYTPRRAWTDAAGRQCREYQTTREVQGRPTKKVYGTACRDPDGQWRIVD
jgi:surface antigen